MFRHRSDRVSHSTSPREDFCAARNHSEALLLANVGWRLDVNVRMNSTARSLSLTMVLYFAALGTVATATYAGVSTLAPAVQAHFLQARDRPQSRLDVLTANAREIRQALATPIAPVEPLPPITARPQRAVAAKAVNKAPGVRLSAQARDAFASLDHSGSSESGHMVAAFDRHQPH